MAPKIDMVSAITPSKLAWNLRIIIVRLWEVPDNNNKTDIFALEMVIQDEEGNRIQATVPKTLVKRFRSVLHDGRQYIMKNFFVQINNFKIKTVVHNYKLVFLLRSTAEEITNTMKNASRFKFVPIKNLLFGDVADENVLFDVIGVIVVKEEIRPMQTYKGDSSQRMIIHIEDYEKNRISCTLFGDLVDKLNSNLTTDSPEPTIVCLQFFKAKKFGGKLRIQSSFYASDVHVNPQIDDVLNFKSRLLADGETSSQKIRCISSPAYLTVAEELDRGTINIITIEEVMNSEQEMPCWIVATLVAFDPVTSNWYYHSCSTCKKKVDEVAEKFYCQNCDRMDPNALLRFKLHVVATDGTGTISLIIWDKEAMQVVGRTVREVKESYTTLSDEYPPMLQEILDKQLRCKINIKSANLHQIRSTYSVSKISTDAAHIATYSSQTTNYDATGVVDDQSKDYDGGISQACSDGTILGTKDQTADSETISRLYTPVKRNGGEGDDPTLQMSSNKYMKVDIKQE